MRMKSNNKGKNAGGRPRGTISLKAAAIRVYTRKDMEAVAKKLLSLAQSGNCKAIALIGELLDGLGDGLPQLVQANIVITGSTPLGGPVEIRIPDNNRADPAHTGQPYTI